MKFGGRKGNFGGKPGAIKLTSFYQSKTFNTMPKRKEITESNNENAVNSKKQKVESEEKKQYWLLKSEADCFTIDNLSNKENQTESWDGVRNHQAKKFMMQMKEGDLVFFYRSSATDKKVCKDKPAITGIAKIVKEHYPDNTDIKKERKGDWVLVDIQLVEKWTVPLSLETLKNYKEKELEGFKLFRQPRLSVMPVTEGYWDFINNLRE